MEDLSELNNDEIRAGLKCYNQNERTEVIKILKFLGEAERRLLYSIDGYSDMITFAKEEYRYSGGVAWHRVKAMRVLREFPSIEPALSSGDLAVASAAEIGQFFENEAAKKRPMSSEDKLALLFHCVGKSTRDITLLLFERLPESEQPVRKERVKRISANQTKIEMYCNNEQIELAQNLYLLVPHKSARFSWTEFLMELVEERMKRVDPMRKRRGERAEGESSGRAPESGSGSESGSAAEKKARVKKTALKKSSELNPASVEMTAFKQVSLEKVIPKKISVETLVGLNPAAENFHEKASPQDQLEKDGKLAVESRQPKVLRIPVEGADGIYEEQFEMDFELESKYPVADEDSQRCPGISIEKEKRLSAKKESSMKRSRSALKKTRARKNDAPISAWAERQVLRRSGGCCEWVSSKTGRRCGGRRFGNTDHIIPRACGGTNELKNLRYLCRAHNVLAAIEIFGREKMAKAIPRLR